MGLWADGLLEERDAFHLPPAQLAPRRFKAIVESLEHHHRDNPTYRRLCDARGFKPADVKRPEDLVRIPLLSTRAFKEKLSILSVAPEKIVKTHHSSGTAGTRSRVPRDQVTLDRFTRSLQQTILQVQGESGYIGLLGPSPEELGDLSFANWARVGCALAKGHDFFLKDYEFEPEQIVATLNKVTLRPVQIGGSPMLILELANFITESGQRLTTLTEDSRVTSGGGFKNLGGEIITRAQYDERVSAAYGVPRKNIRDAYAMSEINGFLSECDQNVKHLPPWLHLSVRNPADLDEEVGKGVEGLPAFLDPLAHSYPGFVVADDIVKVVVADGERCACGRFGPCIDAFIRRAEGAESRGCGRQIEELRSAAR